MFFKILISAIIKNICNFFKLFKALEFFIFFFRLQGPTDLLQGLMINCSIVQWNGYQFFDDSSFSNFLINFDFIFSNFRSFFLVPSLRIFEPVNLFKA